MVDKKEQTLQIRADKEFLQRLDKLANTSGMDKSKYLRHLVERAESPDAAMAAREYLEEVMPRVLQSIQIVITSQIESKHMAELNAILGNSEAEVKAVETMTHRLSRYIQRKVGETPQEAKRDLQTIRGLLPNKEKDACRFIDHLLKKLEADMEAADG